MGGRERGREWELGMEERGRIKEGSGEEREEGKSRHATSVDFATVQK